MTANERIERYLGLFRLRLQQLNLSRGAAAMSVAALGITLVAVTVAIRTGFPDGLMIIVRLLLLASLVALAIALIVLPNRRVRDDGIDAVESRTPGFDGRVRTWADTDDESNPFRELLAEDAMKIAEAEPPEKRVPQSEFTRSLGTAGAALVALLVLGIAGPGNYGYGVRDLWLGWIIPGVAPPQSIDVSPGDSGIRAGGTVRVRAVMQGFTPGEASVHARFGDDEWQEVAMADADDAFEFTFFSVREPLEYYVSAASVRSPSYRIGVVDLPAIERLTNTYEWPEWTGREPETRDPGGDVRAIADTAVEVAIIGTDSLPDGVLIVDDREIPLEVDGANANASFTVAEDGQYYVAAIVGGERIRLTDDYFISVLEDELPTVEFVKPGRDWSASPIEEVTTRIAAQDDFRIESLELFYSVNGGEWDSVTLEAGENDEQPEHVFMLESLLADQTPPEVLVPGDLVSYYAVAADRAGSAHTDIFFVDVQPFDRRYTQSQMAGGGGGQQGAGQNEISQRQREIIVSTWNLIREQQENRRDDVMYVPDNAALLARLQQTLRDQAMTLAQRTRARMLTVSDEQIAEFVDNLEKAAEAMLPAAALLAEVELEEAILPEQEALQYLLRAEAVFNDINVSMQANRGGGGGQAGRDLSDMFELEMDLEKNQYETGSRATPDAPEQQLDEVGNELEELARRQEQLADRMNRDRQPTPAQRWQQDLLRRETEELRQRLERMQQADNQQSVQNQQGESSSGESGQSQPSSSSSARAGERQRRMDELRRRVESALRAMNDADRAMREGSDPESSRQAAEEAQRQLEGARDQAAEERDRLARAALDALGHRAEEAHRTQAAMEERLQQAIRDVLSDDANNDRLDSGLSFTEEMTMARQKRELQTELQRLEQDAKRAADDLEETDPRAADQLERALSELREEEVDSRLAIAANYIEIGEAVYVSGSESSVTEALRDFARAMRRAGELVSEDGAEAGGERGLEATLAETRSLRRQLQELADAAAGDQGSQPTQSGRDDRRESTGVTVPDLDVVRDPGIDFDNFSDEILNQFRALRQAGVPPRELDDLRRLASEIRASDFSGNETLLQRESKAALALIEQLELVLARAVRTKSAAVRATPAEQVTDEHREPVANYFRRLGETGDEERN